MSIAKTAVLDFSLSVVCDYGEEFNIFDQDYDDVFAKAIFNNKWEACEGAEVDCPKCKAEIIVGKVEY